MSAETEASVPNFERLAERVGLFHLRQRLGIEADHVCDVFGQGRNLFHIENLPGLMTVIGFALKCLFLYGRGRRNAMRIEVVENDIVLPRLPEAFDGFTLLHLSDLHVDISRDITEAIAETVSGLAYDACVMTGDYRYRTCGEYDDCVRAMDRIVDVLPPPVYAVLGNHDFIEIASGLERMGISVLLNESAVIEKNGDALHLVGVDDAHFYMVDNLEKACDGVPSDACSILLSHTPELYRKAAYSDFDLMLCGHSHGGQLCLPGGHAVITNVRGPRCITRGNWSYKWLWGYTSRGAGSSGLDVRYNCPPEVTLHRLRRGKSPLPPASNRARRI